MRHTDDGRQSSTYKFEIVGECVCVCVCVWRGDDTMPFTPSPPHTLTAGNDRQVITSTHNTYLISADNGEAADNWVAAIRRVMHEVGTLSLFCCMLVLVLCPVSLFALTSLCFIVQACVSCRVCTSSLQPPPPPRPQPYGGGMFGRSLDETMQVEARLGGAYVPVLLHRCVKFIKEHGASPLNQ